MRFADDDRARVPFALLGALLLVASATFAATVSRPSPEPGPSDAAVATDRTVDTARATVRVAVANALERGAASPVTAPADTPYGRVLNDSSPYRDALRVRAYLGVERALAATGTVSVGDATANASLPGVDDPEDLRAGKRRVALAAGRNGTVTAVVRNVTVTVRAGDRVVARENRTFRVTVASPAIALHEHVERYDERLDEPATRGPGFGRQFAARLYGLAWLRGYAQFGGLPADNVLGTRHVALAANGAALATQRAVFGTTDAAGSRAHREAYARVATRDLTTEYDLAGRDAEAYLDAVLGEHPGGTFANADGSVPAVAAGETGPGDELTVGVNATADDAFVDLLDGTDGPSLAAVVGRSYDASLRPVVSVTHRERPRDPTLLPPGAGWERVGASTTQSVRVTDPDDDSTGGSNSASPPSTTGATVVDRRVRMVTVRRTHRVRWEKGNETRTTSATTTERAVVAIAVHARHAPGELATGSVPTAFESRSRFDPNLVDVANESDRLFQARGGVDAMAARAVTRGDGVDTSAMTVRGAFTNRTRARAYRSVAALRERVRNVTVAIERGRVLTSEPPAVRLLAALRDRREELVDAPDRYGSVAALASTAAQRAYLRYVIRRLEARASDDRSVQSRVQRLVATAMGDADGGASSDGGLAAVQRAIRDRSSGVDTTRTLASNHLVDAVDVTLAGAPAYLVVDGVDADRVPAVERGGVVHPLATRNLNVFTIPSSDEVTDAAGGRDGTRGNARAGGSDDEATLRIAVRQLERAHSLADGDRTTEIVTRESAVERAVVRSLGRIRGRVATALVRVEGLGPTEATVAVADAFDSYASTTTRARAVVNGSLAARVVDAAAPYVTEADAAWRDAAVTRVETALRDARGAESVRPPAGDVGALRAALDGRGDGGPGNASSSNRGGRSNDSTTGPAGGVNASTPAFLGLPLAPVPGYWYATVNVWIVEARGTYPTFAVRSRNGSTGRLGATTYVRDGSTIALDVDRDGVDERLGYADRVTASATVPVVVVVPPGKNGVGDRNRVRDETAPGWPCPVSDRRPGATDGSLPNATRGNGTQEYATRENATANASSTEPSSGDPGESARGECDRDMYPRPQRGGMFHDHRQDVDGVSVDDLRAEYARDLAAVLADRDTDAVVDATGVDADAVDALRGEVVPADLTLEDAAAVLALRDDVPDAESVAEIACDHLLLGMTTGVMDVDAVASDLAIDLDATAVQQKIERRVPMTFNEFVHVQHVIASRQP